jgi:hypothetical protein
MSMYIMQVIRHSPESCPLVNPKNLDIKMNWLESIEKVGAKYKIKVVGVWTDRWGHTSWAVFETPNLDAFKEFELEPENMARVTFTHTETIAVTSAQETMDFFIRHKKQHQ